MQTNSFTILLWGMMGAVAPCRYISLVQHAWDLQDKVHIVTVMKSWPLRLSPDKMPSNIKGPCVTFTLIRLFLHLYHLRMLRGRLTLSSFASISTTSVSTSSIPALEREQIPLVRETTRRVSEKRKLNQLTHIQIAVMRAILGLAVNHSVTMKSQWNTSRQWRLFTHLEHWGVQLSLGM